MADDDRVYRRALPGGGYVAIDSSPDATGDSGVKAHVLVERRSDPGRRVGHAPPVVAEAEAADVEQVVDALSEIADNNVEVARALQQVHRRGVDQHVFVGDVRKLRRQQQVDGGAP